METDEDLKFNDSIATLCKIERISRKKKMLKEAKKGNYRPTGINEFVSVLDNLQAYRITNKYHGPLENISPEVLSDFAEKTHEKLHIHPIFLLRLLGNEINENLEYTTKEANYLLKIIPDAMKKVSRPEQIYV